MCYLMEHVHDMADYRQFRSWCLIIILLTNALYGAPTFKLNVLKVDYW